MTDLRDSPLGRSSATPERYDPAILFPVDRAEARAALSRAAKLLGTSKVPADEALMKLARVTV